MRTRFVALAFVASVLAAPALAADKPKPIVIPPAPPVVVKPVDYFSGIYVGLHGGWGRSNANSAYVNDYYNPPNCGYYENWGCPVDVDPAGAFVGGQIGINHRLGHGNLLFGIEGDYSFASLHDSDVGPFDYENSSTEVQLKVDRLATVQARLGIVHDRWLPFATIGWGWAHTTRSAFNPDTIGPYPNVDTRWHTGLTYGAGVEYAINDKWTVKLEYRHFNGNTQIYSLAFAQGTAVDLNIDTVRFGINVGF